MSKKTKKVYVTRRMQGYAYADGQVHEMPSDQAKLFLEKQFGVRPKDKPEPEEPKSNVDLPEDIPYRQQLIDAGFKRLDHLKEHKSLGTISGVSDEDASEEENEKRVKKLRDYLFGSSDDPSEEGLPEDLPGRDEFQEAGLNNLDDIEGMDYQDVEGIGPATAEKIENYFAD